MHQAESAGYKLLFKSKFGWHLLPTNALYGLLYSSACAFGLWSEKEGLYKYILVLPNADPHKETHSRCGQ